MDEFECKSQVVRTRQQIDLEQEAGQRALHGFAMSARHDFINARMQRGGERILRLIEQGRHEEAQVLLNSEDWGIEDEKKKTSKGRYGREPKGYKKIKVGYKKIRAGRREDESGRRA